jgi:hypothetical protein
MYSSTFFFIDLGTNWKLVVCFTPRTLYPWERAPGTHWIGGWVDPRAVLYYFEKRKFLTLRGLELRPLGSPARSQSLYRLRYPGSPYRWEYNIKKILEELDGLILSLSMCDYRLCFGLVNRFIDHLHVNTNNYEYNIISTLCSSLVHTV